jgi:hypothetical protein
MLTETKLRMHNIILKFTVCYRGELLTSNRKKRQRLEKGCPGVHGMKESVEVEVELQAFLILALD